jgi:peptidoglycan/LPS O-acetylase OafA/YrhL
MGALSSLMIGVFFYIFLFSQSETIDIIDGYYSIIRCLAGFFCGIAAAKMDKKVWPDFVQFAIILLLIFAIAGNYQILALFLMFLVTITTAQNTGTIAKASQKQIPYLIGRSSFSIYLAHVPVGMVVTLVAYKLEREIGVPIGSDWKVIMPIEIFTSCVVGIFAYSNVERRFENFFYKRKSHTQII